MNNQKYWWLILLRGIILIILSIFVFQKPVSALLGITMYLSISLLFIGFTLIFVSIASREETEKWGWGLAGGIVDVLFGFILLSNPVLSASSLPFAIGFWLIFSGAMSFVNAFKSKKDGVGSWWMELLGGLLTVVAGYLISSDLYVGTFAVSFWLGFGFLMAGIVSIVLAFAIKKGKLTA